MYSCQYLKKILPQYTLANTWKNASSMYYWQYLKKKRFLNVLILMPEKNCFRSSMYLQKYLKKCFLNVLMQIHKKMLPQYTHAHTWKKCFLNVLMRIPEIPWCTCTYNFKKTASSMHSRKYLNKCFLNVLACKYLKKCFLNVLMPIPEKMLLQCTGTNA